MSNIKNYNFNKLDFKLSNSDYYDFYLNSDAINSGQHYSATTIVSFDFGNYTILHYSGITSSKYWSGATTGNFSATTWGLTGIDNGSIPYDGNTSLLTLLTGSTLTHTSNDNKLTLKAVSGATGNYIYPIAISGTDLVLNGGFLQGYYKIDGQDYEVLPNRYEQGWTMAIQLNPNGTESGSTLNSIYPDNKGIFFYMGTRAENKFWNIFTGNTATDCTSGSTEFCMDIKETDIDIANIIVKDTMTNLSAPLSPPPLDFELITNKFLIFGRSNGVLCNGEKSETNFGRMRAVDFDPDVLFYTKLVRQKITETRNPFLIFGRSNGVLCNGEKSETGYGQTRAVNYSGSTSDVLELDKDADIIDNAIGFRIKDDGSIGYRLLTLSADCKTVEMIEEYSLSGTVLTGVSQNIVIKWVNNDTFNGCDLINGKPRKGKFKFYLNGKLIFVSKELNEYIGKRLYDIQEKQVGVPYNISIGGGTQGLLESITFDGQDPDDLGLVIERYFAGTFIGSITKFDLFNKNLSWCEIKDIYN